jgi:hypothetical protein
MPIKDGDIGFIIHNDSWISKAIKWFQKCGWSHTFIVFDAEHGITSETNMFNLTLGLLNLYAEEGTAKYEIWRIEGTDVEKVKSRSVENYGQKYGYSQLFYNAIRVCIFKVFKKRVKMFTSRGVTCVENTCYAYGLPRPQDFDLDDWYKFVKERGILITSKEYALKK